MDGVSEQTPGLRTFILAGGLGTRLRPVSGPHPKGMMPIGDQPFLERLIERLAGQKLSEIVLCLGYGAAEIRAYFDAHPNQDINVRYSIEPEPEGTAGALREARQYWLDENFILNGDTELQFDLASFLDYHRRQQAEVTVALAHVHDASRFGRVQCANDGRVLEFVEKDGVPDAGFVNAGVYLASRRALNTIPQAGQVSIEKDWVPALLREGHPVYGCAIADGFTDIGTPDDYRRLAARALDSRTKL
jgi:D-glycero-alpha-D-manno-heptose 1-phosphate guanylyltransferase